MKRLWKQKNKLADDLLGQLFGSRNLASPEQIEAFLDPKYEHAHDPYLMKDIQAAVERIQKAIEAGEKITVYADYDADAVTAAAVLLRFFEHLNYKNIDYYIPDRFAEGYGMNLEAVKQISERGTKLIITVDCGINAFDSVVLANELGVDTIITDHHQLTGGVPAAVAVVNPHRPDDTYPFKDLTGVGVAFKLVQALTITYNLKPKISPRGWEKWLLDLVAIGTVADCQSLLGENRILVKWGLQVLEKTRWVGLKKILELASLDEQKLDTYKIGFIIAPRINAAGRIEHANLALELLLTNDESKAQELAEKLEELNRHRQELTEQILSEAREQLVLLGDKKVLLAAGRNWPKGVVGLVAGKLTEEFARPVLVLEKGQEEATGSARSVANFNIVEAIGSSREILVRYGGHPMAAGFTLRLEHIEAFHQNLLKYADGALSEEDLSPVLHYDAEISLSEVNDGMVTLLEKFAPFGMGNPRPRFRINNLEVKSARAIGNEGKHLRINVTSFLPSPGVERDSRERSSLGCIGFNLGFWAEKLKVGEKIDVICEPQFNDWNGERNIQLKIVDLKSNG